MKMGRKTKTVAIYARVSTDRQKVDMQLHELRQFAARSGWNIYKEYIDQNYSGGNTRRPAFTAMMDAARKRKVDLLLVWKLDRLSRSLKDLIITLDDLGACGIDFVSYDNNLDTSTPTGKLVFQIVGAILFSVLRVSCVVPRFREKQKSPGDRFIRGLFIVEGLMAMSSRPSAVWSRPCRHYPRRRGRHARKPRPGKSRIPNHGPLT